MLNPAAFGLNNIMDLPCMNWVGPMLQHAQHGSWLRLCFQCTTCSIYHINLRVDTRSVWYPVSFSLHSLLFIMVPCKLKFLCSNIINTIKIILQASGMFQAALGLVPTPIQGVKDTTISVGQCAYLFLFKDRGSGEVTTKHVGQEHP